MNLYAQDKGWHGWTRHGNKAHRIYRPSRFPGRLTACTSLPVFVAFRDDTYPEGEEDGLCRHCYPTSWRIDG